MGVLFEGTLLGAGVQGNQKPQRIYAVARLLVVPVDLKLAIGVFMICLVHAEAAGIQRLDLRFIASDQHRCVHLLKAPLSWFPGKQEENHELLGSTLTHTHVYN